MLFESKPHAPLAGRGKGHGRALVEAVEEVARCLGLPRLLLCSTDDPNVKGTWRHLGFHYSTEQDLKDFGVQHGDLLHMDNTVQMHKVGLRQCATHNAHCGLCGNEFSRHQIGPGQVHCDEHLSGRQQLRVTHARAGPLPPDVGRQVKHILAVTQVSGHTPDFIAISHLEQ